MLICIEEACGFGGFISEVIAQVAEKGFDLLDAPILVVSGRDCPIPYSLVL